MTPLRIVLLLGIASLSASATAFAASDCIRLTCPPGVADPDACELPATALRARLPARLAITSIRGGTAFSENRDSTFVDCAAARTLPAPLSLDRAAAFGAVHVRGALHATGVVRFEPSDGFTLAFMPNRQVLSRGGRFFREAFEQISLDEAVPIARLGLPRRWADATCWQAKATLDARDFDVVRGDSDAAGAHPRVARLTALRDFEACR